MNIVFFGTSNVALPVLEALYKHHTVLAVVTSPDAKVGRKQTLQQSPVALLADELKIPILKPEKVKNNTELLQQLRGLDADIYIVVSYGKILPLDVINLPALKTLNVHFSLLSEYRGASPLQQALLDGKTETGTTIFILDELLDHGPILAQAPVVIEADDNFTTLADRAARISAKLLIDVLPKYQNGEIAPEEQGHSQATTAKIITKEDGRIDWNKPAQEIYNQFRAFYEWPGIWTLWNNQNLKITDCALRIGESSDAKPGTVLVDGSVSCGNGTTLHINQLQLAGKNETDIQSFLNGYKNFPGNTLGL